MLPSHPVPCAGEEALCFVPALTSPGPIGKRLSLAPGSTDEPDEVEDDPEFCRLSWLRWLRPALEPGGPSLSGGASRGERSLPG